MQLRYGIAMGLSLGLLAGLGGYTFVYARGASYLENDPSACSNCHVMNAQYAGWQRSSHRAVAVCNDCHTPQGAVGKYITKMRNGFWHSFYFTTGEFRDPIRITPRNLAITEQACRTCHQPVVDAIDRHPGSGADPLSCVRCHVDVGHLH